MTSRVGILQCFTRSYLFDNYVEGVVAVESILLLVVGSIYFVHLTIVLKVYFRGGFIY